VRNCSRSLRAPGTPAAGTLRSHFSTNMVASAQCGVLFDERNFGEVRAEGTDFVAR
jgi:hypothetical protein